MCVILRMIILRMLLLVVIVLGDETGTDLLPALKPSPAFLRQVFKFWEQAE